MKPILHLTAPVGWINDPNGLIYYQGNYHVFYQSFPYATYWGTMHWGHAITKDFVHYEHMPIALYPSKPYDKNGCFSGSALEIDGKMYLYYTSIVYEKSSDYDINVQVSDDYLRASQSMLISDDGIHFDNRKNKQLLLAPITDPTLGHYNHTRDPKVITINDHYYMLLGSKVKGEGKYDGEVLIYESVNGIDFHYKNRYSDASIGDMWECPDFFQLDNQYLMTFSPENIAKEPLPNSGACYKAISIDEKTMSVESSDSLHYIDEGLDFYAPQTFLDEYGNRVLMGWLRMREAEVGEDWVGMLSMPRILNYRNQHLYQEVYPTIKQSFNKSVESVDTSLPFYLYIEGREGTLINIGGCKIEIINDQLVIDRTSVSIEHEKVCNVVYSSKLQQQYTLEIYYDYHIIEIYINDGEFVMSQVLYNEDENVEVREAIIKEMKIIGK